MGKPTDPEIAILFAGLLYGNDGSRSLAESELIKTYGNISLHSSISDWSYSDYYKDELGDTIRRKFLLFERIISPDEIADIKTATNAMERRFSEGNKRTVNIDPGYLTLSKLVLASSKDFCHRIFLKKGIYAEVTLYYQGNGFRQMPFTYLDYKQDETLRFFEAARAHLKERIYSLNL